MYFILRSTVGFCFLGALIFGHAFIWEVFNFLGSSLAWPPKMAGTKAEVGQGSIRDEGKVKALGILYSGKS